MKKFKFSILALVLGTICSLGLFGFSNPKSVYAAEPETINNYYMLTEDGANSYLAETTSIVGRSSGYGDFIVGKENVTISANAETGYRVAAWKVTRGIDTEINGTLTYASFETVNLFNEEVIEYSDAADDVTTYTKLYKRADGSYFTLNSQLLDTDTTITTNPSVSGLTEDINIYIDFADNNLDGKTESSTLKIERVFEDLQIDAVYDYIYYKLDITSFVNKIKLPTQLASNFSGYTIYGENEGVVEGYTKIKNTIIKKSEFIEYVTLYRNETGYFTKSGTDKILVSIEGELTFDSEENTTLDGEEVVKYTNAKDTKYFYYYVGDIYADLLNVKAYAKHPTMQETPEMKYIDVFANDGVFRLNDEVELGVNINFNEADVFNSININVVGAKLNGVELANADELSLNTYKITQHSTIKATEKVDFKLGISNNRELINKLEIVCENLYVVSINKQIDGISSVNSKKYENITLDGVIFANLYEIDSAYYTKENNEYTKISLTEQQIIELGAKTYTIVNPLNYEANLYENVNIGGANYEKLYEIDGEYFHITENVRVPLSLTSEEILNLPASSTHVFNDAIDLFKVSTFDKGTAFITVQNQFSVVDEANAIYLAKANAGFKIICASNYSEVSLGTRYYYYNFKSLTNSGNVESSKNEDVYILNSNRKININYSTTKYNIDFVSIVNNSENGLNTKDSIGLNHGQSINLTEVDASVNAGYNFIGYKTSKLDASSTFSLNVKINKINPTSKTIYLSYEYIDYLLKIVNINSISIGENKALSELTLNVNGVNKYIENADLSSTEVLFTNILNVGDNANLTYKTNNGFKFYGFGFEEGITNSDLLITSFDLDEQLINSLSGATTIVLYAYEDYIYYSLTYKINPTIETVNNENVIMADISVVAPVDAVVVQKNVAGENVETATDKTVSTIEITNLKFTDIVKLESEAKSFTDSNGKTDYYVFQFYTSDGKTSLSYEFDAGTYYHDEEILSDNRTITVVYSMPITKLNIFVTENSYDFDMGSIVVTSTLSGITTTLNTLTEGSFEYEIAIGADIYVAIAENGVKFGYILDGYTFKDSENNNLIGDANGYNYSFTAQTGLHNLSINFNKIEYRFTVKQQGANFIEETTYNFGTIDEPKLYTVLNIDNTTLQFNRPEGYYVKQFKINGNIHDTYAQTNSNSTADSVLYSVDFGSNFKDIVGVYNTAIHSNGVQEITINVMYEIYTYYIMVEYKVNDSYIDLNTIIRPQITATKNGTVIATGDIAYYGIDPIFMNIEYGSVVVVHAAGCTTFGVEAIGFSFDSVNFDTPENVNELNLGIIKESYNVLYKLKLLEFDVNVTNNSDETIKGYETVSINKISIKKPLTIEVYADRSLGYTFDKIVYNKPVFSEYEYTTDEAWEADCKNLYVLHNGKYCKSIDNIYNEDLEYFTYSVEEAESTDSTFEIMEFSLEDYAVSEGKFNLHVIYKELAVNLNLISGGATITGVFDLREMVNNNINKEKTTDISNENYALYYLFKDGESVTNDSCFTVKDEVTIIVAINGNALGYDLRKGLTLSTVYVEGEKSLSIIHNNDSTYTVKFKVSDIISKLKNNSTTLNISFNYTIQEKTIKVTTNIKDSSFYGNQLTIQLGIAGSNTRPLNLENNSNSGAFLQPVTVIWAIKNDHIKISKYNVYDAENKLIDPENYITESMFFSAIYEETGNNVYGLKLPLTNNNYTIELVVEPIIYLGGTPSEELEEKEFIKVFKYDIVSKSIVAQINTLDIGVNDLSKDISIPAFAEGKIKLVYTQEGREVNPINVGTYDIEIKFESSDWIKYLKVSCKLSLKIVEKSITLSYALGDSILEKIYDGTNAYNEDVNNILKYLVYHDGGVEIAKYSDLLDMLGGNAYYTNTSMIYHPSVDYYKYNVATAEYEAYEYNPSTWASEYSTLYIQYNDSLILNSVIIEARITKTDSGNQIAVTSASNEKYNILLSNIQLINNSINSNFVINLGEGVETFIISNIIKINPKLLKVVTTHAKLEKKIYDGSTKAKFTEDSEVSLQGYIGGDDIKINIKKIKLSFEDGVIGLGKRVEMDPTNALEGVAASNYYLEKSFIKNEAIYPYSVTAFVEGFGEVVLYNERGLQDNSKADLIPIGAILKVEAIKPDTAEYVDLYSSISKYISRTKVFIVGYKLTLEVDSISQPISNELFLSIPKVEDVENVIFVSGENTGELSYEERENSIEIDLSSMNFNIETIAVTQHQALLALWQIVLIVTGGVVIVGGTVTAIVIITIKRKRKNELLEKI